MQFQTLSLSGSALGAINTANVQLASSHNANDSSSTKRPAAALLKLFWR